MSKTIKILIVGIVILIVINIVLWINLYLLMFKHNDFKPIDCSCIVYTPSQQQENITLDDAIAIVNEHFDISYTLKFKDMRENGLLGNAKFFCGISWFNTITLDNDLSGWETIYVLTHELCHIKYYTCNETFTEYMTFIELYESDNEIMHNRGEWLAREQVYYKTRWHTEYDCSYYIKKYLNL